MTTSAEILNSSFSDVVVRPPACIRHLCISAGHNFVGHHGRPPGRHPTIEVQEIECVAGRGIRGDRYFDHAKHDRGQVTFFAEEVFEALCRELGVRDKSPVAFRRNVITRGLDLNSLIGVEFEIQGVRFFGTEECKPCYWMDQAFHPGADVAMRGRGGLRARILTSGALRIAERHGCGEHLSRTPPARRHATESEKILNPR